MSGDDAFWPELPDQCPPAGASPKAGTFYRLVDGSAEDWASHFQIYGLDWCLERPATALCDFHSLSLFANQADACDLLTRARFRNSRVVAFTLTTEMGDAIATSTVSSHHNWWPHRTDFRPPPVDSVEVAT